MRIVFFGTRRSGNHGIQQWIADQYLHPARLYNQLYLPLKVNWRFQPSKQRSIGGGGERLEQVEILSFEDYAPEIPIEADHYVAVLRDPYNCFASRLTSSGRILKGRLRNLWQSVDNWKAYTKLAEPWILINYNRWVSDPDYASSVPIWGKPNLPARIHRSSFDDTDFLNRWQRVRPCEEWDLLLQRDDIRQIALRVFGWCLTKEGQYATHL